MEVKPTIFSEVFIIKPDVFVDNRGFFLESYSLKKLQTFNIRTEFVQDNHSKSEKNTIRGLHFSAYPGQIKLVRCTQGSVWDVCVDIRPKSPTFRQWIGIELSETNFLQLYIPVGFAHGYLVLSDTAEVQYKVDHYYDPKLEKGILWNDTSLKIDWKIKKPILSHRDTINPTLDEILKEKTNPFEL